MLYGWMKSLVIYLIFAGAVINLSPSGNYKKYIKFFTGIVAIIILMKPISYIFGFDESTIEDSISNIESLSFKEEELDFEEMVDYYDMSLSEGIKIELCHRGFMVEKVSVITDKDGALLGCTVYIDQESQLDYGFQEDSIKKYLFQFYNLQNHNINVVRR